MGALDELLSLVAPVRCVAWGIEAQGLCARCRARLRHLDGPLCDRCGRPTAWPVRRCSECAGRAARIRKRPCGRGLRCGSQGVRVGLEGAWRALTVGAGMRAGPRSAGSTRRAPSHLRARGRAIDCCGGATTLQARSPGRWAEPGSCLSATSSNGRARHRGSAGCRSALGVSMLRAPSRPVSRCREPSVSSTTSTRAAPRWVPVPQNCGVPVPVGSRSSRSPVRYEAHRRGRPGVRSALGGDRLHSAHARVEAP